MKLIQPINSSQKNAVIERTHYFIDEAQKIFDRKFDPIDVSFDLKGRIAGMYRARKHERVIRYNPYIFAKYFDDNLAATVPHEVAHYVTNIMFKRARPHGKEWQEVMQLFDADASRTCDYDLEGIPVKNVQRHTYHCLCMTHELSSQRHNKIMKNKARYFCKKCNELITEKRA